MKVILGLFLGLVLVNALDIPPCGDPTTPVLNFGYWNGETDEGKTTRAEICHDQDNLVVTWTCKDDQIIAPYEHCNDPLYNGDAVEIFIASKKSYPTKYYEFEVSPNSVLFYSDITNPSGNCSKFDGQLKNCDQIEYKGVTVKDGWQAGLRIKLDIIDRGDDKDKFYINLFRIDVSSQKKTRYLSWQPTLTEVPCFHVPGVFEKIKLVD